MSFSCTIKAGEKELTKYKDGEINCQLLGLGPNGKDELSDAPHRVDDFRSEIANCVYGDRLPEAAQDCFLKLQAMAKENLAFLKPEPHCETCKCELPDKKSIWWSAEELKKLLQIDAKTITYIKGGW